MRREPLRIAMLSLHSSPTGDLGTSDTGGLSVYVRGVAAQLGAWGHRVDLFTGRGRLEDGIVRSLAPGVRLVRLEGGEDGHSDKLGLYPQLPGFAQALEEFRREEGIAYDLVHSHYWLSGCLGMWAQRRWHVPHVVMFHTLGAVKNQTGCGEEEPRLRLAEEELLAQSCDRVIAPTHHERENLVRYCGAAAERVEVIPCGVDQELFRLQDRLRCRGHLGLGDQDVLLLYVGRLVPVKGLDLLLESLTRMSDLRRASLLVVGGDGGGQDAAWVRQRAVRMGVEERVRFLGRLPQDVLPRYYGAADLVVLPSYYESFALVPLEAMSCGTPVVGTRVGAMEEVIRKGVNGFLAEERSPGSLARALTQGLQHAAAGAWRPEAIRASVSGYSWSSVAGALLAGYEELLGCESASRGCACANADGLT